MKYYLQINLYLHDFNIFKYFSGFILEPVPEEEDEGGKEDKEKEDDWQGVRRGEWTGVLRRPSIPATTYTRVIQVFLID